MIYKELFDWQQHIVDAVRDKQRYGLFLDCGLGKTPIAMTLAECHNASKILVVSINSKAEESATVSGSWLNWAAHLDGDYNLITKKQFKKPSTKFDGKTVACINYEGLYSRATDRKFTVQLTDKLMDFLKSCKNEDVTVILDESHKVKECSSLQTKAITLIDKFLAKSARSVHLYLLTGTPFTVGFIDLYTQLKFLGCPFTKQQFIDTFCVRAQIPGLLDWQQPIKSYKNIDQLYALVHQYALTIKSKEVICLPEQIFVNHPCDYTQSFKMLTQEKLEGATVAARLASVGIDDERYLSIKDKKSKVPNLFFRNIAYPSTEWIADTPAAFWLRAREMSIGFQGNANRFQWYENDRLNKLKEFLSEAPDNYIIFYNYTPEMLSIFDICKELGYLIDIYCGEIKSMDNYDAFEKMTDAEKLTAEKRVIIANYASGSTGKNWQCYNKCIMFSIPLYKDYEQALKRINRIGQKETTVYHVFFGTNWLDSSMWKALRTGTQYTEELFKQDLIKFNKEE